ncbi:Triacylglycerol lipase 2 [Sesamum alatum]|uniref:Triacylglycerol lipase 2 n=1 Tax=Sesamum alatum TaxID=300844 RepID=A0AAE1YW68_9LAMI|nr:Triacylglycerol lipase 2 [Sesamum alatum]
MDKLTFIFLAILLCGSAVGTRPQPRDGRATLAADGGVCSAVVGVQNYPCNEHNVTSGDGYILSLQNIPFGQSGNAGKGQRPPVLLHHGVLTDAVTWLLSPPEQSLALLLADNGFDVWLVNARGTKYSLGHTSLSSNDPAFWDWTWDELVTYDLPATFQYIYDQTGQKLHYVGHSMGTLIAFAAFPKGQLVDMLRSASMLCPIAYIGHMTSPLARTGAEKLLAEDVKLLLDNLHDHEQDKLVVEYTENYAHADYVMGFNAKQDVYDPLMAFLRLH